MRHRVWIGRKVIKIQRKRECVCFPIWTGSPLLGRIMYSFLSSSFSSDCRDFWEPVIATAMRGQLYQAPYAVRGHRGMGPQAVCVCLQEETSVLDCHRPLRLWQSFQQHQLNLHVHLRFQKRTDWICSNKENNEFNLNLPSETSALLGGVVFLRAQGSRTLTRSAGERMSCWSP